MKGYEYFTHTILRNINEILDAPLPRPSYHYISVLWFGNLPLPLLNVIFGMD